MNIALSTLVIFILILPGIIYRRFYFTEEFSKQYFKQNLFGIFTSSIVPAIALHALWFFLTKSLTPYQVNLEILGYLFSGGEKIHVAFRNIQTYDVQVISYHLSIMPIAGILGFGSKYFIRLKKWDRRRKFFRFQNSWHYLFTGEFFDFPKASFDLEKDDVRHIELVYVDVLLEIKEGSLIYEGILVDYELSKEGGLEYIILKKTIRRFMEFRQDSVSAIENSEKSGTALEKSNELLEIERHFPIRGHVLVIPYKDIKNINFSYYKIASQKDENGESFFDVFQLNRLHNPPNKTVLKKNSSPQLSGELASSVSNLILVKLTLTYH